MSDWSPIQRLSAFVAVLAIVFVAAFGLGRLGPDGGGAEPAEHSGTHSDEPTGHDGTHGDDPTTRVTSVWNHDHGSHGGATTTAP